MSLAVDFDRHAGGPVAAAPDDELLAGAALLVIEDQALIAFDLESALREAGAATVECHASVAGASAAVDGGRLFDAAIVDFQLIDGDASALIAKLPRLGIPVIVTTAADPARFCDIDGVAAVFQKPYVQERLIQTLAKVARRAGS